MRKHSPNKEKRVRNTVLPILELSFWAIRVFRDSLQASTHTKEEQGRQR